MFFYLLALHSPLVTLNDVPVAIVKGPTPISHNTLTNWADHKAGRLAADIVSTRLGRLLADILTSEA